MNNFERQLLYFVSKFYTVEWEIEQKKKQISQQTEASLIQNLTKCMVTLLVLEAGLLILGGIPFFLPLVI